ncbi:ATP-binding cassette domain-containing protein [Lactobacillus bombicola]|uniref:ATP-binding cassette domain-containing protein n=1 Tax=Lactobacillus bombicola TaxID=1505723 RepID=UPI000E5890E4|nr:ABC transporter ATP-binding protein [Lactobacillus bombicola]RHW51692.1 hypothetical protein DS833_02565 [Lactobacillus bombicola]
MKKNSVLDNLRWLTNFMGKEKFNLISWPLVASFINLLLTLLTSALPAVVVWTFSSRYQLQTKLLLLVIVSLIIGFLSWLSGWYDRKMFWENTKLSMRLAVKDAELYLTQDFADSLSHEKQQERFTSTQYAFSNETTGVGIFIPALSSFVSTLLTLIIVSLLTVKVSWLVLILIWLSIGMSDYLLKQFTIKRRAMRGQIDCEQLKYQYYTKISFDENASDDIRLYHMAPVIEQKISVLQKKIEASERAISHVKVKTENLIQLIGFVRFGLSFCLLLLAIKQGKLNVSQFTFYFSLIASIEIVIKSNWQSQLNLRSANSDLNVGRSYFDSVKTVISEKKTTELMLPTELNIKFDHVCFGYEASKLIIKDLSLEIRAHEHLAFVGRNGAGKTTLMMLLMGYLKPTSGKIYFGEIDSSQLSTQQQLGLFSAMFQENTVLATDILHNLSVKAIANPVRAENELKLVGLSAKVKQLEKGLETPLTKYVCDNGQNFSGGELESLMLARALYKSAPMMILDEPTAALDALSEKNLYEQIAKLMRGKTTIFISHRLASTAASDRVCFMENGQIAGLGKHKDLLKNNAAYYNLYQSQAKYYQEGGKV